jgi:hypothetical protein
VVLVLVPALEEDPLDAVAHVRAVSIRPSTSV